MDYTSNIDKKSMKFFQIGSKRLQKIRETLTNNNLSLLRINSKMSRQSLIIIDGIANKESNQVKFKILFKDTYNKNTHNYDETIELQIMI